MSIMKEAQRLSRYGVDSFSVILQKLDALQEEYNIDYAIEVLEHQYKIEALDRNPQPQL